MADKLIIGSQEEEANKGNNPLEAEDYIVKVAKIDLAKAPTFVNGTPNWSKTVWSFKTICLPYCPKAGGECRDTIGKQVDPLTRFIFRDINPFSVGFMPDEATPAFCRAFICYMEGVSIQDRFTAPDFVLLDKEDNVVTDKGLRKAVITELNTVDGPRELSAKGYHVIPDLRPYEGKYIACAIEVDKKGNNKITKFSKLPASFVVPSSETEREPMDSFKGSYAKMKSKMDTREAQLMADAKAGAGLRGSEMGEEVAGEIEKEDIHY